MRRFLLTIPAKFKGAIEALYNSDGKLTRIDFSNVDLPPEIIKWFKTGIPVLCQNMEQYQEATMVAVEEADFEVTFEDFKKAYPRKRNTHLAEKYWPRLATGNKQYLAYIAAIAYAKYCTRKGIAKDFIMLPERFLKEEHWKNDWSE